RGAPPDSWITISAPIAEEAKPGEKAPMRTLCARVGDLAGAAQLVREFDESDLDAYFGLGARREKVASNRRGSADDVVGLGCIWVDIDIGTEGHASKTLPPNEETATELLESLPLPSMLVHSGGGLHAYWLLSEWCDDAPRVSRLCRAWQERVAECAKAK